VPLPANYFWVFDSDLNQAQHKETGERLQFRGEIDIRYSLLPDNGSGERASKRREEDGYLDAPGWFRFDYYHGDKTYPLLVGQGSFNYPNPNQYSFSGDTSASHPLRIDRQISGWSWLVEQNHSLKLWRLENVARTAMPDQMLWHRADRAITEAAFLWGGEETKFWRRGMRPAQEVAIRGGWLNGRWENTLQRRVGIDHNLQQLAHGFSTALLGDDDISLPSPRGTWHLQDEEGRDRLANDKWTLRNSETADIVAISLIETIVAQQPDVNAIDARTSVNSQTWTDALSAFHRFEIEINNDPQLRLEMLQRPRILWPTRSYDGVGEQFLPFGSDWMISLRQVNYAHALRTLDIYLNALMPLTHGLLGDFSPPTLSTTGISAFGVPISGDRCGVMTATLADKLEPSKIQYGWDEFFF